MDLNAGVYDRKIIETSALKVYVNRTGSVFSLLLNPAAVGPIRHCVAVSAADTAGKAT